PGGGRSAAALPHERRLVCGRRETAPPDGTTARPPAPDREAPARCSSPDPDHEVALQRVGLRLEDADLVEAAVTLHQLSGPVGADVHADAVAVMRLARVAHL